MADSSIKTINVKSLQVIWGPEQIHGFADDIVEIEQPEDDVEVVSGADGEVTHIMKTARHAKITVTLKQTSLSNAVFSAYRIADRETGAGIFPFTVRDASGTTLFFAPAARIIKAPNIKRSKTVQDNQWVFGTGPAETFIGGN